jgi:ABC-type antimicrobial peptide transport system permease subunit
MFKYAVKRVSHSAKLFAALLIATTLGTTFFAGASVASDVVTRGAGTQALSHVVVDFYVQAPTPYYPSYVHSSDLVTLNKSVSGVNSINATEIISYSYPQLVGKLNASQFIVVGVENNSLVMRGIQPAKSAQPLGANETYVYVGSPDLNALSLKGSIITLNFTSYDQSLNATSVYWNLTVKGVVSLSDRSLSIAKNELYYNYYGLYQTYTGYVYRPNILIVNWNKTSSNMIDLISGKGPSSPYFFQSGIIASIDHDKLVSSYDVAGAVQELNKINAQLSNLVSSGSVNSFYNPYVQSPILNAMSYYQYQLMILQSAIIGALVPIFFIAWYIGNTASGVSFNLRRREIGLLSARGFTRRNIMRLFITEAILIGLISGLAGFLIGTLMIPLVFGSAIPSGTQGLEYVLTTAGLQTAIITIVIGVLLSVFTVYRAASRASSMKTIDALKEYTYVEQAKKPVSKWVWLAFILGTYKMIAWIIGLNFYSFVYSLYSNVLLFMLVLVFMTVDGILSLLGPILFLYGTVRLVTQGSSRLQRKVGSMGRSAFGESGLLATKNVQRNPARNFAVAFIVALIVGYGVIVIGGSASNYDYQYRLIYYNVGADVSTHLTQGSNVTLLSSQVANITGVSAVSLIRYVYPYSSQGSLTMKAVDPVKWRQVAYYEESWFRGASVEQAFQSMAKDNFTIILDSGVVDYLSLRINDTIGITFNTLQGQYSHSFRVVGFFGPEPLQISGYYGPILPSFYSYYGSYIPAAALNNMNVTSVDDQLLIKLNPNANATSVVQNINNNVQNVTGTLAASTEVQSMNSNYLVMGSQDMENIGMALVIVGASLEIAVVVAITFLERKKELAILSVRGMSSGQVASMLLVETLSIVGFALALGLVVGFIVVVGSVNSTALSGQLVTQRFILPLNSVLLMVGMVALVMMAAVTPAVVAARRAPANARKKGGW